MPIHDWSKLDAGLFHAFHQGWIIHLTDLLNGGGLPEGYFALPEQYIQGPIPDILTLHLNPRQSTDDIPASTALAVQEAPVQTRWIQKSRSRIYVEKATRISIRHRHGEVVAAIEIISPGNKASKLEIQRFTAKALELLAAGINLLLVDLFPPTPRDPQGIHALIWEEIDGQLEPQQVEKPLLVVSYDAVEATAYVEPLGAGDLLPEMPIFLHPGIYVKAPLESSYQLAWEKFPKELKKLLP